MLPVVGPVRSDRRSNQKASEGVGSPMKRVILGESGQCSSFGPRVGTAVCAGGKEGWAEKVSQQLVRYVPEAEERGLKRPRARAYTSRSRGR